MATTKNLHLMMTASAAQLEGVLKKTEGALGKVKTTAESIGVGIPTTMGAGLGVAKQAAGFLFEHLKSSVDEILELEDASSALGISMEKVAGIKFASDGKWDAAQAGIGKMVKNLGEASYGSKEAAKGFELLNLKVDDLADMKTEDVLGVVADRLNAIENPYERAYAANELFGKGWQSLIPLLEKGSAGIDKATEATNRFGEMTEENVQRLKQQKLQFDALDESARSFSRAATLKLSEKASALFTIPGFIAGKFTGEVPVPSPQKALTPAQVATNKLIESIGELENKLREEQAALEGAGGAVDTFARKHADATPKMLETARALEAENQLIKDLADQEKELGHLLDEFDKGAEDMLKAATTDAERFANELMKAQMYLEAGKFSAEDYAKVVGNIVEQFDKLDQKDTRAGALVQGSSEAFAATQKFATAQQDAGKRAEGFLQNIDKTSKEQLKEQRDLNKTLERVKAGSI